MKRGAPPAAAPAAPPTPWNPFYDKCQHRDTDCECSEDKEFVMSDSCRRAVQCGIGWVIDHVKMELDRLKAGETFDRYGIVDLWLPPCFAKHYTARFMAYFLTAVHVAGEALLSEKPYFSCTAEELAAHAILDSALEVFLEDEPQEFGISDPKRAAADIEYLKDVAFEDEDVLMLFDMPGFEKTAIAEYMGVANLEVNDWFKPFRGY